MAADGQIAPSGLTIDALAQETGTTTRNIRAYQTRGILAPPRVVGRTGHYGPEHVERLRLVARLQERGYSLAAIADLVGAWQQQHSVAELLGLERQIDPRAVEAEASIDVDALRQRFPALEERDDLLERAVALELLVPDGDGYRVTSPSLLQVGVELVAAGIPVEAALDELAQLRVSARDMASRFFAMFRAHVWRPWEAAGRPLDQLPELLDAMRRLKPLPAAAVSATLGKALEHEVNAVIAEHVGGEARERKP